MSAPSWPRLVAATTRPGVATARGRWRTVDGKRSTAGTFVWRAPDELQALDDGGVLQDDWATGGLPAFTVERGDDYHRPVAPPVEVLHDGRRCWQVSLEPPARKRGLLEVVVDDATGLCVRLANADGGLLHELTDLEVDVPVTDRDLAPLRDRARAADRDRALWHLVRARPVPTPRWFPARRTYVEQPGTVGVESDRGTGAVSRGPLGTPAPVPSWYDDAPVHHLEARGWSWAVVTAEPVSREDAERVVAELELD